MLLLACGLFFSVTSVTDCVVMPEFMDDSSINITDSISAFTDHLHARIHFIAKIRGSNLKMEWGPWQNFEPY